MEDEGNKQPLQALMEEIDGLKKKVAALEAGSNGGVPEDEEQLPVMERKKREATGKVRIYREVDVTSPGRNPVDTPSLGDNAQGKVPGEGKYVESATYDADKKVIEGRVGRLEEAAGIGRDDVSAGSENPVNMNERMRENLSRRKTIVGSQPKAGFDKESIRATVKEAMKGGLI